MGADALYAARTAPYSNGTQCCALRRHHGQSIHEDDGKRGPQEQDTIGYDAGKRVKGRKRHLLVDTNGLLVKVVVHSAAVQDRDGARLLLEGCQHSLPNLKMIWADGGYRGQLVEWAREKGAWTLEIVNKPEDQKGFAVLPRRWVVERTFAWLGRYRRLAKDYDLLPKTTEAFIHLAMIHVMIRRMAP